MDTTVAVNLPKWYRLDNAAKIYPVVTSNKKSHVFRIAANMKHDVIPDLLQQAVRDCKLRFPNMYLKLKRGFFWYYYEANDMVPIVKPEDPYLCRPIDRHLNNGFLFTFFYFSKRISLEIYHGLCDGAGAMEFMKTVLHRYLELTGARINAGNLILSLDDRPTAAEVEDSYLKYFSPEKRKVNKVPKAYKINARRFRDGGTALINAKVSVDELIALAKSNNCTITQYLAALLTYCIMKTGNKRKLSAYPVKITIPVNMRRFFPSGTLRNFSLFFRTSILFDREKSFNEILDIAKTQFDEELQLNKLNNTLYFNVAAEKSFIVRALPLFIKKVILKTGYHIIGKRASTSSLSNLGNVNLPEDMNKYIESFDINLAGEKSAVPDLMVISYNGIASMTFSRGVYTTKIEKAFLTYLADMGLEINVLSNNWENH
jgi:NRPS condensation-like uncharacterized protein